MKNHWKKLSTLFILGFLLLVGCGMNEEDEIIVGGGNYSEQYIAAEILSTLIEENTDLTTTTETNITTTLLLQAIQAEDVDLYMEYTGTGLINIGKEPGRDPEQVYETVKSDYEEDYDIKWMDPYGFNNTYAMVVTQETAEEYNLETVSDLAEVADELHLGSTHDFTEREDGYPGLSAHYGFEFADVSGMDAGLMYSALVEDEVDVISAFSTDGRIPAYDLIILEDDQQFFPPYDATTIVRMDVLEEYPELEDVLDTLTGRIDEMTMAELNARVDLDKEEPADVARDFLISEGLIEE